MSIENRRFARYVITFPVEFSYNTSPGIVFKATSINISLGGLQIFIKDNIEERYDKITITMFLPNKEIIKQVEAQGVYFKRAFEGILIGFMFLNMGTGKFTMLKNYLESLSNK